MASKYIDFPEKFDEALKELASEYNLKFHEGSYYDVPSRKIEWSKKNEVYGLRFMMLEASFIDVVYYQERFPIFPKLLTWCHNYIPLFPYFSKGTSCQLLNISLTLNKDAYKEIVKERAEKGKRGQLPFFLV